MLELFGGCYDGRRVLVTGHTGFKGSWLCLWLAGLGAEVRGYSLPPVTSPNHFDLLSLPMETMEGDILDRPALDRWMKQSAPEMVFHLAAQSIVRASYEAPIDTLQANIMGTAQVLDACRACPSVQAVVVVTSDKCYLNEGQDRPYREGDPLGGFDPYSASKAAAEIVTASFRQSFFSPAAHGKAHGALIASARAGNVIGGGDWAAARLIPDIVRAAVAGAPVALRNPDSIRPWQHVLDCLAGYLLLGRRLLAGDVRAARAWNFGPDDDARVSVREVVNRFQSVWDGLSFREARSSGAPHEAAVLRLDTTGSRDLLGWRPVWNLDEAMSKTVEWYRRFYNDKVATSGEQLHAYVDGAKEAGAAWATA